ncbi:hypothetical protein ACFYV5_14720 [Streptomyces sp. NPDC003035]|uniref:hypothetical protein n=1 Tax=Streptomyces sp. NPDC003035 TaxID=3364676 RepID=UPI0036761BB3
MVSPSSFSSSSGPPAAILSWRFRSESRRARAVISWTGRSTRPAVHQPTTTAPKAMTARARQDHISICSPAARLTSSLSR